MNINWSEFAKTSYWFGIERGVIHLTDKIILGFGAALVILGVLVLLVRILAKNQLIKPSLGRISSVFISVGLLEMLWYLLRTQYVNVLSSRTAALLIGVVGLMYLYKPIKYFLSQYKNDLVSFHQQQLKDKYLKMTR